MTIGILIEVDGSACEVHYTLNDLDAVLGPAHNMAVVPKKDGFEISFACESTGAENHAATLLFRRSSLHRGTQAHGKTLIMNEKEGLW
jgi:hypothetical protein